MDGYGFDVQSLLQSAADYMAQKRSDETELEIAKVNAGATTAQAVSSNQSRSLLYLGIGILGAAYLLFTLRRMEN